MHATPHDALFKATFSSPERAAEVLRGILDPGLVAQIDWSSLALQSGSFIDDDLAASHADLLFSARTIGGTDLRIYLLLEHQSTPDHWMAFWLLKYMVRIWDEFIGREKEAHALPPILPVVLYHGSRPWTAATEFSRLVELPDGAAARAATPKFLFTLADLSIVDPEVLLHQDGSAAVRLALLAFREGQIAADLEQLLRKWGGLIHELVHNPQGGRVFERVLRYLYAVRGDEEFRDLRSRGTRPINDSEEAMETFDEFMDSLREQGREQGRAQGQEQGRAQGERLIIARLVRRRFAEVPAAVLAKIDAADESRLVLWADRLLSARSVDEVFVD